MGGGIIGASVAYYLAKRGVNDIVVFEREDEIGTGATAKCAGGVRLQFSTPANVELSRVSIEAFESFESELDTPIDYRKNGYLFVLTDEDDFSTFRANAIKQQAMGVPVEALTPEGARAIVPELELEGVVGATFCREDGVANPHAILMGYARAAKRAGVTLHRSAEVSEVRVSGERVAALRAGDEWFDVDWIVNAAGPWARSVGALAGVDIPVDPVRRQYYVTKPMDWIPDSFPLLIDQGSGVYMHKESGGMLIGESDPDEPPGFNQQVDWEFLAEVTEHAIARVPRVAEGAVGNAVAGLYEVTPDHNAILGPVESLENYLCANGFSGHGMQHAPAVGQAIAELIVDGAASSVDISAYRLGRFDGATVAEFNVI